MEQKTRLIPITKWNDYHPWPPLGGLRHLAFYDKRDFRKRCLRRVGKRLLIDEAAFFEWVSEETGEAPAEGAACRS